MPTSLRAWSATSALAPPAFITNTGKVSPERMPSAAMLEFYVQKFDTVELNNSFYRLLTAEAFRAS